MDIINRMVSAYTWRAEYEESPLGAEMHVDEADSDYDIYVSE